MILKETFDVFFADFSTIIESSVVPSFGLANTAVVEITPISNALVMASGRGLKKKLAKENFSFLLMFLNTCFLTDGTNLSLSSIKRCSTYIVEAFLISFALTLAMISVFLFGTKTSASFLICVSRDDKTFFSSEKAMPNFS